MNFEFLNTVTLEDIFSILPLIINSVPNHKVCAMYKVISFKNGCHDTVLIFIIYLSFIFNTNNSKLCTE